MSDIDMFPEVDGHPAPEKEPGSACAGAPRLLRPQRAQTYLRACDFDSLIGADHPARMIWAAVEQMDLAAFHARVDARENEPGRPAIDPALVIALLLYGRSEGIVNAREIERRCESDDAFRWLCGGVGVNHHLLSDYESKLHDEVDALFNQLLAVLLHQGLVRLDRTAHDGTRVRAYVRTRERRPSGGRRRSRPVWRRHKPISRRSSRSPSPVRARPRPANALLVSASRGYSTRWPSCPRCARRSVRPRRS
jgi:transposase